MIIHDPIYGKFNVEAPLGELIGSAPLQRLKGIHQGGAGYLGESSNQWWSSTYPLVESNPSGVQVEVGKSGREGDIHRRFKNRVINPWVYIGKGNFKRASELLERVRMIQLQVEAKFRDGAHVRVISR